MLEAIRIKVPFGGYQNADFIDVGMDFLNVLNSSLEKDSVMLVLTLVPGFHERG